MKKSRLAVLLIAALSAACTNAETAAAANKKAATADSASIETKIRAAVKSRISRPIDTIRKTPYGGLYELNVGGEIIYTDVNGQFLVVGRVLDTATGEDLTKVRFDEVNKIKFADLPFDSAVKLVKGDGKRVIAIFEDPNCGYCKRFRQTTLKETDNITVYSFMFNILSPDSAVKAKNIWCAPNRDKAWDDWMVANVAAPEAAENCATPNEKILELGQRLHLNGTPSIIFSDGSRIASAISAKELEAKFTSLH